MIFYNLKRLKEYKRKWEGYRKDLQNDSVAKANNSVRNSCKNLKIKI